MTLKKKKKCNCYKKLKKHINSLAKEIEKGRHICPNVEHVFMDINDL